MNGELQLFLLWNKARTDEQRILDDIKEKYQILRLFEVKWPKNSFPNNFIRFYSKNMRGGWRKALECGRSKFLLAIVWDDAPEYQFNERRNCQINCKAVRNKNLYRQWTGGGFLVHASDNLNEVNENLLLTLGINRHEFEEKYSSPWDGNIIEIDYPMPGYKSWKDINELLDFAKKIEEIKSLQFVNNALELRCTNITKIRRFLNLRQPLFRLSKRHLYTLINNKRVNVVIIPN